jgi:hypothetical protein
LVACAPIEDDVIVPAKTTYYPFALNGNLVNKVGASNLNNYEFSFAYDTTNRPITINLFRANGGRAAQIIRLRYLENSDKLSEIKFVNVPSSIWPSWQSLAVFEYNNLNQIISIAVYADTVSTAARRYREVRYSYQDGLLKSSKYYQYGKIKDSLVFTDWTGNLPITAFSFGKMRITETINLKYDTDSILDSLLLFHPLKGRSEILAIGKAKANTDNQPNASELNPLWIFNYLYYLQDLRFPPPRFSAKLAKINRMQYYYYGCTANDTNRPLAKEFNLSNLSQGNLKELPIKVTYNFNDNCSPYYTTEFGGDVFYTKLK